MASAATATEGIKVFGVFMSYTLPPPPPPPIEGFKLFGTMLTQKAADFEVDEKSSTPPPAVFEVDQKPAPPPPEIDDQKPKRGRLPPPHRQELPSEFRDLIASKGTDSLELILGRCLTETDMGKHHNRMSMPQRQIKKDFLNPDEEELIQGKRLAGKRTLCNGIEVMVVDPSLNERTMSLVRWNAKKKGDDNVNGEKEKSWWYALTGNWTKIAGENHLQIGDAVQVWSFRFKTDGRLGLILHKVQPPPPPPPKAPGTRRQSRGDGGQKRKKRKTEEGT